MLSYQHIYHAGNFADVHKHAILAQAIKALRVKPAPMAVLDTHAGRGLYDLSSDEALKTNEFQNGIPHFIQDNDPASPLAPYLDIVRKYNPDGLSQYPGTAMIARNLLRPTDKLTCIEKHPGEFAELEKVFSGVPHTQVLKQDSFETLGMFLPFAERRGIVIIDPSYEIKTEYAQTAKEVFKAWKKWPQGCYLIWYPMLDNGAHRQLLTDLVKSGIKDVLVSEVRLEKPPQEHYRMTGSGIILVNPPWPESFLQNLTQTIARGMPTKTFADVFWLDNQQINPETGMLAL